MPVLTVYKDRRRKGIFFRKRKASDFGELADAVAPKMQRMLRTALSSVLSGADIAVLARAVRNGNTSALNRLLPPFDKKKPDKGLWADLHGKYLAILGGLVQRSGSKAQDALPKRKSARVRKAFDLDNPYTARWLKDHTAQDIADISDAARANIKNLMTEGWAEGIPPDKLADLIKPLLGLNEIQGDAVARRYQSHLDAGMDEDDAADKAAEYADDLLEQRCETIARTETIAAENAGIHDAWMDAKDQGYVADDAMREWVASSTELGSCEYCAALDGETAPLDGAWETDYGDGETYGPPLHPRCRCTQTLVQPGINDRDDSTDEGGDDE